MISDPLRGFVRSRIKSVWALELLLLMHRRPAQCWTVEALTAELRGSGALVTDLLAGFEQAGLVGREGGGAFRYSPNPPELRVLVQELEQVYAERPLALINEIVSAPNEKIQSFADAFRLKQE